jgi:hypothetical protein
MREVRDNWNPYKMDHSDRLYKMYQFVQFCKHSGIVEP